MKMHDIICDSGALISLTASSLDNILYFFAHKYNVRFIIPPSVEFESIEHPIQSSLRQYLFSAMRIKRAMNDCVISKVDAEITEQAKRLMQAANNLFYVRGKALHLIDMGEAEVISLGKAIGVEYILLDERTTRLLI